MLILGVDPGTAITGYGLLEQNGNQLTARRFGVLKTSSDSSLSERLKEI